MKRIKESIAICILSCLFVPQFVFAHGNDFRHIDFGLPLNGADVYIENGMGFGLDPTFVGSDLEFTNGQQNISTLTLQPDSMLVIAHKNFFNDPQTASGFTFGIVDFQHEGSTLEIKGFDLGVDPITGLPLDMTNLMDSNVTSFTTHGDASNWILGTNTYFSTYKITNIGDQVAYIDNMHVSSNPGTSPPYGAAGPKFGNGLSGLLIGFLLFSTCFITRRYRLKKN